MAFEIRTTIQQGMNSSREKRNKCLNMFSQAWKRNQPRENGKSISYYGGITRTRFAVRIFSRLLINVSVRKIRDKIILYCSFRSIKI